MISHQLNRHENIALLAYYAEKYSINPKDLLNNLTKQ